MLVAWRASGVRFPLESGAGEFLRLRWRVRLGFAWLRLNCSIHGGVTVSAVGQRIAVVMTSIAITGTRVCAVEL